MSTGAAMPTKHPSISVISPHRDDAALSLGLAICLWTSWDLHVRVVNCFTISNYAPHSVKRGREAVTRLRASEDAAFGAAVMADGLLSFADARRLDAPIRLRRHHNTVCGPASPVSKELGELRTLAAWLRQIDDGGLVVCPLGVGGHVDHDLARRAAIAAYPARRMAFFEDLPYSAAFPHHVGPLAACVSEELDLALSPVRVCRRNDGRRKRTLLQVYSSQLSSQEQRTASHYSRSGERVWATRWWKERHDKCK